LWLTPGPHFIEIIKDGYETYKDEEFDLYSNRVLEKELKIKGGGDPDDDEPQVDEDSIMIKDSKGNPIVNADIKFTIGNVTYNAKTDAQGIAKFNITVPSGTKITITMKDGEERSGTINDDNKYTWVVDTEDPKGSGGISQTLIFIIIGIVALVVIFIVSFLIIKKRGSSDDDYDDDDEEEEEEYEEEKSTGPSVPAVTTVSMGSCSKCGTVAPQGTTFCPQCGNNMKAAHAAKQGCRGCGTPVNIGVAFCPNCGMSMSQGQLPVAGMQPVVPQLPQQTNRGAGAQQSPGAAPVQQQPQARLPPGPAQSGGQSLDDLMASATVGSSEPPLPPPPE